MLIIHLPVQVRHSISLKDLIEDRNLGTYSIPPKLLSFHMHATSPAVAAHFRVLGNFPAACRGNQLCVFPEIRCTADLKDPDTADPVRSLGRKSTEQWSGNNHMAYAPPRDSRAEFIGLYAWHFVILPSASLS